MSFGGLTPEPGVARIEGFYDFDGPRFRLVTEPIDEDPSDMTAEEGGEQRLIGDVLYSFPHPFSRGSELLLQSYWLQQPADVPTPGGGMPLVDQFRTLLTIPNGFEVETETVDGDETTYEGVIDHGDDPPEVVTALDLGGRISVTTNEEDLPVRLQWFVDQEGPDGRLTMAIEILFENFGTHQDVERPPAKRTVTLEEYEEFMDGDYFAPVGP